MLWYSNGTDKKFIRPILLLLTIYVDCNWPELGNLQHVLFALLVLFYCFNPTVLTCYVRQLGHVVDLFVGLSDSRIIHKVMHEFF